MSSDDPDLLGAIAQGDDRAFEEFLRRHGPFIARRASWELLRLQCVDVPVHAQDVCQNVSVRLRVYARLFDGGKGSVLGWLIAITRNAAVDHRGKDCTVGAVSTDEREALGLFGESPLDDVELTAMWREQLRELIKELTLDEQRILMLKFVEEYSDEEIAPRFGMTSGALKVRRFRLLRKLRDLANSKGFGRGEVS